MAIGTIATIAGITALASLLGTGINHIERATDRNFNAAEAQKQRDWEEQMSSTAYQRGTEDMQAAGLNPAMMYANGANPASTPSGSSASTAGQHTNMPGIINAVANVAHVMNNDKNSKNDITIADAVRMVGNVAKVLK